MKMKPLPHFSAILLYHEYNLIFLPPRIVSHPFRFVSVQGRWMTWLFVKENWDELHKRYQGGFLLGRLIKVSILSNF